MKHSAFSYLFIYTSLFVFIFAFAGVSFARPLESRFLDLNRNLGISVIKAPTIEASARDKDVEDVNAEKVNRNSLTLGDKRNEGLEQRFTNNREPSKRDIRAPALLSGEEILEQQRIEREQEEVEKLSRQVSELLKIIKKLLEIRSV